MSVSSLSSQLTLFVFLCAALLLLLPASPIRSVASSNICICECCEGGGRCSRNNTRSFTIYDDCTNGCTKDFCEARFEPCFAEGTRLDVIANCVSQ